jgi:hypothetical protein
MALVPFPGGAAPVPDDDDPHIHLTDPDPLEDSGAKMSFLDHLDELRKRLIACIYGLVFGCVVAFFFVDRIQAFIWLPLFRELNAVNGTKFNNPGLDTINASAMPAQNDGFVGVVIYGGAGNDVINGSQDDDRIAGGSGDDTIHAGAGNDHVYGDSSFNVNLLLFAQDQINRFAANDAAVSAMFAVPTTQTPGASTSRSRGPAIRPGRRARGSSRPWSSTPSLQARRRSR